MKFEEEFFCGEIRNGFYVETMMKKVWAAQLEVLRIIDDICTRHKLRYYADWGTLLGAVRHKGFVPWDDDMDITMPRKDLEKFLKIAAKELPEGFQIANAYTRSDFDSLIMRVVNGYNVCFDRDFLIQFHGCPYVVGLDIFPLDNVPSNQEDDELRCQLLEIVLNTAENVEKDEIPEEEKLEALKGIEQLCGVTLNYNGNIRNQLIRIGDSLSKLFAEEESDRVAIMYDHATNRKNDVYPKEWYEESIRMPFENTTIPVPIGYKDILKVKYGENYMTPRICSGGHTYPFYRAEQEKIARQVLGFNPH